ncbi:MAG: hypothetical protein GY827_02020 [Cytophagales bacterium]|nr:hypothetical protein [Cytophagales bacterium]
MFQTFLNILPLFLLILLGFIIRKIKLADQSWVEVLNKYSLNLGFPCLIFFALIQNKQSILEYQELIFVNSSFLVIAFFICFSFGVFFSQQLKKTIPICLVFSNIAFLGIPTLQQIYGKEILAEASIISSCYLFWVFTIGIAHLEYFKLGRIAPLIIFKNLLKNPLLIAVVLGLLVNIFQWQLPNLIFQPIEMIANSVTPLVLISLGIFIANSSWKNQQKLKPVILLSLASLSIFPALLLFGIATKNVTKS